MDITAKVLNGFWNERVRIQLVLRNEKRTLTCGKQIESSESHATFSSSGCHQMSRGKTLSLDRMESIMLITEISSGRFRWLWFSFFYDSSRKGGESSIGFGTAIDRKCFRYLLRPLGKSLGVKCSRQSFTTPDPKLEKTFRKNPKLTPQIVSISLHKAIKLNPLIISDSKPLEAT
jgi:hypothetical protein